ncbi:MAG: hypothetical protein KC800_32630 [Candidatus Eremiobacteraeota bacterium]|nr:hypothetical protein [Candidatus Eremiobacteraeota bacterium]
MGVFPRALEQTTMPPILSDESDVELLRELVEWFLRSQDPELDDNIYDRNDEHLVRTILLPRIKPPFDPDGGTTKDRGLLRQVLQTALQEGAVEPENEEKARSLLGILTQEF